MNKLKYTDLCNTVYNVEKNPRDLIVRDGTEEVHIVRKKKELEFGFGQKADGSKKEVVIPAEVIQTKEAMVIRNFEVDFEEEPPDVRMIGGIRGISALRVQRAYMPDVDNVDYSQMEESKNPYEKYEARISPKKHELDADEQVDVMTGADKDQDEVTADRGLFD